MTDNTYASNSVDDATFDNDDQEFFDQEEVSTADSSSADDGEAEDLISVIQGLPGSSTSDDDDDEADADSPPADTDDGDTTDTEDDEDGSEEGDELASDDEEDDTSGDPRLDKNPRFRKVISQRNEAREKLAAMETEAEGLRDRAGRFDEIVRYQEETGLGNDELVDGLEVMALAKRDPDAAFQRLVPFMQQLAVASGRTLTPDLEQRVKSGQLDKQGALEISRTRAAQAAAQQRQQFDQQRQQQAQQSQQQQMTQAINATADAWEAQVRQSDPDFDAKRQQLEFHLYQMAQSEGPVQSQQGVQDRLNRAYEAVNQSRAAQAPKPAKRPIRQGQPSQTTAHQEPASILDIVRRGGA